MSAPQVRTELPSVAAETAGCSCCSIPSTKQPSRQAEGTGYSVTGLHTEASVRAAVNDAGYSLSAR